MSSKIRIGIAGLGRTGWKNHAARLAGLSDLYTVEAVSDPNPERRAEAVERFSCKAYATYEELLADQAVEVVVVATPSTLHKEQTIAALEAGKAVVCEKPMAVTLEDADAMIAVAERTGNLLTVFQNNHFAPDYKQVEEVIQSGVLGKIVMVKMRWNGFARRWDWQTLRKFGGGSLNNTGPHPVEQALRLFGEGEAEIFCDMQPVLTLGDAEDHVKIILKGKDAPVIDLEISSAASYNSPKWTVWGTQGGLTGSASEIRWKYFDPASLPAREVSEAPTPDRSYNREEISWSEEQVAAIDMQAHGSTSEVFYRSLYQTIREGAPLAITPAHARRVMATIQHCHDIVNARGY